VSVAFASIVVKACESREQTKQTEPEETLASDVGLSAYEASWCFLSDSVSIRFISFISAEIASQYFACKVLMRVLELPINYLELAAATWVKNHGLLKWSYK